MDLFYFFFSLEAGRSGPKKITPKDMTEELVPRCIEEAREANTTVSALCIQFKKAVRCKISAFLVFRNFWLTGGGGGSHIFFIFTVLQFDFFVIL